VTDFLHLKGRARGPSPPLESPAKELLSDDLFVLGFHISGGPRW